MNPTNDVLEKRFAAMSGGAAALALSSGTAACFYSIINCASSGDNFVSAGNLYGGTFTQFHDILPQFGASSCLSFLVSPSHILPYLTPGACVLSIDRNYGQVR
jgi:O-acetylhomoserine (thiol)-lyase